ncbi:YfaZ family protein [Pantoea sp. DY-15]|uniref:YfaZ family outer membrane protein n=1 Tax=Pantoea sp. DY-15 TaxID=2871489 RepID=UPI001C95B53D|nr:YfaZ family outer membrane protein [Pantoea sp. DY-15]MBY4889391.1 YfaZ family protein [Pantoea sp. DY-15]
MKQHFLALGLMLASTGIGATETGIKGSSDFFAAAINSEKNAAGLQYGAEYVKGEHQTQLVEANLGYGFTLGALHVAPRVGLFWADLDNDKSKSQGANAGIRLMAPLPKAGQTWLYLDYSMAPDFATYHLHHLHQLEVGIYFQPANWLTLSSGYRYLSSDGKYGENDQRLIDGLFMGAAWRF